MKITFNVATVLIVLIAIYAFFSIGQCSRQSEVDRLNLDNLNTLNKVEKDSLVIDGMKRYAYTQSLVIISKDNLLKESEAEKDRLKKLHIKDVSVIGSLNAEIAVLNKKLSTPTDPVFIEIPGSVDSSKYLKVPQRFEYRDKFGWAIADIKYPDSKISFGLDSVDIHITIGEQKNGLFKKKIGVSVIDTPNPYVQFNKNNIVVVQPKKKFYERPLFLFGLGFASGAFLTK